MLDSANGEGCKENHMYTKGQMVHACFVSSVGTTFGGIAIYSLVAGIQDYQRGSEGLGNFYCKSPGVECFGPTADELLDKGKQDIIFATISLGVPLIAALGFGTYHGIKRLCSGVRSYGIFRDEEQGGTQVSATRRPPTFEMRDEYRAFDAPSSNPQAARPAG